MEDVVYPAELQKEGQREGEGQLYVGLAGGKFKKRHANHTQSFNKIGKRKASRLSEAVWILKDQGIEDFNINISYS